MDDLIARAEAWLGTAPTESAPHPVYALVAELVAALKAAQVLKETS